MGSNVNLRHLSYTKGYSLTATKMHHMLEQKGVHITRNRPALLWEPISTRQRRLGMALSGIPMVFYVAAMIVADAAHQLSLVLYLSVPACYFAAVTILRDRPATAADADDFT